MVVQRYAYQSAGGGAPASAVTVTDGDGTMLARVSWHIESPARARVMVEGDIDPDSAPVLGAEVLEALAHRREVCCDLRHTSFFGAAGVHALASAHVVAAEHGSTVLLAGVAGMVERVLRVTGMLEVLAVEP